MEFRSLKYFLEVCQMGNISRAAEKLHVTQPTLSRQVAELERELGCKLLIRHSRSVEPTEEGLYLIRRAREAIELMDRIRSDISLSERIVVGDVSISACESSSMSFIALCIRSFQELYPAVQFHIHSGHAAFAIDRLERGLDDFALLLDYPNIERYEHLRLEHIDQWGCFIPTNDPFLENHTITADALSGKPLIVPDQALEFDMLSSWFGDHLDGLDIRATFNLGNNGIELVRAGVGYMLSLGGVRALGERSGLEFRALEPAIAAQVDFAWCRRREMSRAARLFIDLVQEKGRYLNRA